MCLTLIYEKPWIYKKWFRKIDLSIQNKIYTGYKVFNSLEHDHRIFFTPILGKVIPIKKWVTADSFETISFVCYIGGGKSCTYSYKSGFHIFLYKRDAKRYREGLSYKSFVRKVKFKNVITLGREPLNLLTVVAKEMMIPWLNI
jgi:hypothetical protein